MEVNYLKKITVLVNKNWETDGVMSALVNNAIRPQNLPYPEKLYVPGYSEKTKEPRAIFLFKEEGDVSTQVTVRCIQDMMYYEVEPDPATQSGSSSAEKYRILPSILEEDDPDLVISVSTAGYPADFSCNGSVVIGGNFFLFDGHPGNPKSNLKSTSLNTLLPVNVNKKLFSLIDFDFRNSVEPKFLKTPHNPCDHPLCIASHVFTALSVINVTEYEEYNWADHEAMAKYNEVETRLPCNSSETTHGVVKLSTNKPIIFVSPITDQFGHFDFEVTPTQNYAASFNAGIAIGHLLCALDSYVKDGNSFSG